MPQNKFWGIFFLILYFHRHNNLIHARNQWHRIRGFKNRIVHDYMGIDYGIVWDIRNNYLNVLIDLLKAI
jgi:uncharacterized protein with HEPN domain